MEVRFTAIGDTDLARLRTWLAEPHVSEWWGQPKSEAELRDEYGPPIRCEGPTRCFIVHVDGRAIGMVQTYRWADYRAAAENIGAEPGEVGIDYLIGEPALIGTGIGPIVLARFLADLIWTEPRALGVRTIVAVANRRSWRCLEKLDFTRSEAREIAGEVGPQYILRLRRPNDGL
jgi:aminoglycoside 6'-N-acetyltransferase